MPICNTNEFLVKRFFNNKVMCLDIGEKRWGVALSNPNNSFSLPLKVLDYDYKIINSLNQIIEDYNIDLIIIGLPLNNDNSLNRKCQSIRDITTNMDAELLKLKKSLPILFWDESFSTESAKENLDSQKFSKRTKQIDKFAASIILQDFLDFINKNNT